MLGGVAPVPWRVNPSVEEDVASAPLVEDDMEVLAERALYDAQPLSQNGVQGDARKVAAAGRHAVPVEGLMTSAPGYMTCPSRVMAVNVQSRVKPSIHFRPSRLMKRLLVVIEREYMERVRTKWFLVATIFGPLFFGLLMFLPAWLANRTNVSADVARIRILDATGASLGQLVALELGGGVTGDTSLTQVHVLEASRLAEAESTATRADPRQGHQGIPRARHRDARWAGRSLCGHQRDRAQRHAAHRERGVA